MNGPRKDEGKKTEIPVSRNPKATQRYEIEERMECGLVLGGSEVKSLRKNGGDLEGAYARLSDGELFLVGMYIAPYDPAAAFPHDPRRQRKLLANKREIEKWSGKITMRGYALVPTRVYFKGSWAKAEIGLGKGRKVGDDREKLKAKAERDEAREAVQRRRR
jgi:SsrA-binding protein